MNIMDNFLNSLNSMASVSRYDKTVEWWRKQKLSSKNDYLSLLSDFGVIFTCNSNMIEGSSVTYHTTRDIFEGNDIKNFSGSATEIIQVTNQKFAFNFLIDALLEGRELDINFVKRVHRIMLYGCYDDRRYSKGERPGEFKVNDYCVGMTEEGSLPNQVLEDMEELLNEMRVITVTSKNLLKVAAYFHLKFECIHPFADGNGRVGRALLNYFLMLNNHPPTVLYDEDREIYYLALEVYDRTGEIDGFVEFLREQTVKTWESKIGE